MIEVKLLLLILGMVQKAYNYGNAELCDADIIPERWIKIYNDPTPIDIVE